MIFLLEQAATPTSSPYIVAAIAVGGTLLGGVSAAIAQAWNASRQHDWSASDRAAEKASEERRAKRSERQELYLRFLRALDEYDRTILDVAELLNRESDERKVIQERHQDMLHTVATIWPEFALLAPLEVSDQAALTFKAYMAAAKVLYDSALTETPTSDGRANSRRDLLIKMRSDLGS